MHSLDEIQEPETRAILKAAVGKDLDAGVPLEKLVRLRMTFERTESGLLVSKGFSFNILVSDHAAFFATLNAGQQAEYRGILAKLSGSSSEDQIATFPSRVRVLLGHDERDPTPGLRFLDAQLIQDTRVAPGSPFAPLLRPCQRNDGPESKCVMAPEQPGTADK